MSDVTTTCRDISALTEKAQKACDLFMTECKKQGLNVLITETYRSQERQNYLYEQGRTRSGNIVTWTKNSRHTSRRAWDICKNIKGQEYSDSSFFKKCGAIAKQFNITWGGDWSTPDTPHFEISENWDYKGDEKEVPVTVMKLPTEVYVQEINPLEWQMLVVDEYKNKISHENCFNGGFFTYEGNGKSIPVGNLANNGQILAQAKDQGDWINVAKKKLTTLYTKTDGTYGIIKTDRLDNIPNLKTAVSGIPIIIGGRYVPEEDIKKEGYFGTGKNGELYNTFHGFLGIRHGKIVYVGMQCDFGQMCWALVALGIYDAIKIDGGSSFLLKNGKLEKKTNKNPKINNIVGWM